MNMNRQPFTSPLMMLQVVPRAVHLPLFATATGQRHQPGEMESNSSCTTEPKSPAMCLADGRFDLADSLYMANERRTVGTKAGRCLYVYDIFNRQDHKPPTKIAQVETQPRTSVASKNLLFEGPGRTRKNRRGI